MGTQQWRKRLITFVGGVGFLVASAVPAAAQDNSGTTVTQALAITNSQDVVDTAFKVVKSKDGTVDEHNRAIAYAYDCTGCDALAISFQIVLASNGPTTVTPVNEVVAVNERCTSCHTGAFGKQFVVTSTGQIILTEQGEDRLEQIEEALEEFEDEWEDRLEDGATLDLATLQGIDAQVDAWAAEVRDVLRTQVVPKGADDVDHDEDDDEAEDHDD